MIIAVAMYTFGIWKGITGHAPGIEPGLTAPEPDAGPLDYLGCFAAYVSYIPQNSWDFKEFLGLHGISWNSSNVIERY